MFFSQRFSRENGMSEREKKWALGGEKECCWRMDSREKRRRRERNAPWEMFRFEDFCGPLIFAESTNGLGEMMTWWESRQYNRTFSFVLSPPATKCFMFLLRSSLHCLPGYKLDEKSKNGVIKSYNDILYYGY